MVLHGGTLSIEKWRSWNEIFLPWNWCCDRNESTENANESYTDLRQDVFAPVPEDMTIKKYDFFDFYVSLIQAISL